MQARILLTYTLMYKHILRAMHTRKIFKKWLEDLQKMMLSWRINIQSVHRICIKVIYKGTKAILVSVCIT